MNGFLAKFFSSGSIISRVIRALLVAFAGAVATGQIPLPHWAAEMAAVLAALIPAGQNQSSATTAAAKAEVPPHA